MDFSFDQLIIGIVAVMMDLTVIVLFLDKVAQRIVAVIDAFVLGKAVAADSASIGKVMCRVVAVVLVRALGIGVIPATVGLVVGTDEVAGSPALNLMYRFVNIYQH